MISSSVSVCDGYAAPGCISTRSRSAPRPQPSVADTPGAMVTVGSVLRSTGSPAASVIGTVTAGSSRFAPSDLVLDR